MTRREALLSMGYKEVEVGKWLKPVGFHCFSYLEERNLWENWFKDMQGKISLYDQHSFSNSVDIDPLGELKGFEAWSRININHNSSFELFAIDI